MQTKAQNFRAGLRDGLPICLGYFAVSFAFGIQAAGIGLSVPEAAAVSAANLTSAGQFAALGIIAAGASYLELAFTQLVINLRYFLMSCALSQRLSPDMRFAHRFGIAYGMTDEIFAVSFSRPAPLSPYYSYGLIAAAVPGWVLGTTLGAAAGSILPGVGISLNALTAKSALLSAISLEAPEKVIGKNTEDCMRSGSVLGTASMLDGMYTRIEQELGACCSAVATGGFANVIIPSCHRRIDVRDDLVLLGLKSIYHKNQ